MESAVAALDEYFATGREQLKFTVARAGFAFEDEPIATGLAAGLELASALRDHGVAEVSFSRGTTADDLLGLLTTVARPADEIRAEGGISAVVAGMGVHSVGFTDVQLVAVDRSQLSSAEPEATAPESSAEEPDLGEWFANVSSGDLEAFREGLAEFLELAGDDGAQMLAGVLARTLTSQTADQRDALLTVALEPGAGRQIAARMFALMDAVDIAGAILDGKFGRNMLALSNALANLPFDDVSDSVHQQVLDMLPVAGHGPKEAAFLDHMLEVRSGAVAEPSLVETDRSFRTIVQAGSVSEPDVARALEVTNAAADVLDTAGVHTMLTLLDTQADHDLFVAGVDSIVGLVPRLLDRGALGVVSGIVQELLAREAAHPEWRDLRPHLMQALAAAIGPDVAAAIVRTCVQHADLVPVAQSLLRFSGDSMPAAIAAEGIVLKHEGLRVAEDILGMRIVDLLNTQAGSAQWFQLGPIVERLARDSGPRSMQTIESLLARPDEPARREVVTALAATCSPALLPLVGSALRDSSEEVAAIAARGLARSGLPGAAALLSARLAEIDVDNVDFGRARELIGALARTPEPAADQALGRLAARRALIKRGRFGEVQQLVAQAIAVRGQGSRA